MKPLKILILVLILSIALVGCGNTVERQKREITLPSDALLRQYEIPEPPATAEDYSVMPWDDKEVLWVNYTNDLLVIIKNHMADKDGIRAWGNALKQSVEKLNQEQLQKR